MRRLLSVHYKPVTYQGQDTRWPVEVRLTKDSGAISRLYLSETEALNLRALLNGLPEEMAELPEEEPPRALRAWPKAARF